MLYEKETSMNFTPVKLGEIVGCRSFLKTGKINEFSTSSKDRVLGISAVGGELTFKKETIYDPKTLWSIMDGIEASMWAMIFAEWGSEKAIQTWCDHFVKLIRKYPDNLPAVKEAWDSTGWTVCLAMRSGETFDKCTAELIKDLSVWMDFFHTTGSPAKRQKQSRATSKGASPSGKGQRKGSAKQPPRVFNAFGQPQQQQQQQAQQPAPQQQLPKSKTFCKDFQIGKCSRPSCIFTHSCSTCNRTGHGASQCKGGKGTGKRN
jgi:hypothetical protein